MVMVKAVMCKMPTEEFMHFRIKVTVAEESWFEDWREALEEEEELTDITVDEEQRDRDKEEEQNWQVKY